MDDLKTVKPFRSRKRKHKDDDEEYDFHAEVKKKKTRESKQQKQAKVNLLKGLLKRSNFYANSLLSLITEQQKKRKKKAEAALKKRREKLKRVGIKIRKDYGKKCKEIPQSYKTFLESEDNQIRFGEKPCFRVAVVVSHLVKKSSNLAKEDVTYPLSPDDVKEVTDSFSLNLDKILSWNAKNDKSALLAAQKHADLPSSTTTCDLTSVGCQPVFIENIPACGLHVAATEVIAQDVADVMQEILDKVTEQCTNVDLSPLKNVKSVNGSCVMKDENFRTSCELHLDETPTANKQSSCEKRIGKCRRFIDLDHPELASEYDACKLVIDHLLTAVCQEVTDRYDNGATEASNESEVIRSVIDNLLDEICIELESSSIREASSKLEVASFDASQKNAVQQVLCAKDSSHYVASPKECFSVERKKPYSVVTNGVSVVADATKCIHPEVPKASELLPSTLRGPEYNTYETRLSKGSSSEKVGPLTSCVSSLNDCQKVEIQENPENSDHNSCVAFLSGESNPDNSKLKVLKKDSQESIMQQSTTTSDHDLHIADPSIKSIPDIPVKASVPASDNGLHLTKTNTSVLNNITRDSCGNISQGCSDEATKLNPADFDDDSGATACEDDCKHKKEQSKVSSDDHQATALQQHFIKKECEALTAVSLHTIAAGSIQESKVPCPICCKLVKENKINEHLDTCIMGGERRESLRRKQTRPPPKKRAKRVKTETLQQDHTVLESVDTVPEVHMVGQESHKALDQECQKDVDTTAIPNCSEVSADQRTRDDIPNEENSETKYHDKESNPWKVTEIMPEKPSLKTGLSHPMIASGDEEEEAVETEGSSSESESEIIAPPATLRRSTRISRCKKSYREFSDSDDEEENTEEDNTEPQNVTIQPKTEAKESEKKVSVQENSSVQLQKGQYSVGDTIKVIWGQKEAGKLYKAKILDRCPTDDSDWTYLVHYIGWNDAYDDWIFTSDIHSVLESYDESSNCQESVADLSLANEDYIQPQGVSLLDEKFYMPGSSRSTAPTSMLTVKNGIKYFKNVQLNAAQPKLFTGGALRDYQITGYEWLKILLENGENGILADEMGLGKTIQCISIICKMVENGIRGPFLICAPMSTIQNWFQEFRRFAPKVPLLLYHGTRMERETLSLCMLQKEKRLKTRPVVITTYDILMRDHSVVQSRQKLLLTGTPLQNNLSELWSLLNFLLPEVFDDLETFENWFDIGKLQKNQKLLLIIHKVLTPFLLRRMKMDVDLQLPPKRENIIYAPLTSKQDRFYRALVNRSIKELVSQKEYYNSTVGIASPDTIAQQSSSQKMESSAVQMNNETSDVAVGMEENVRETVVRHFSMSNIIMQLRKCCNHPYLIEEPGEENSKVCEGTISCSGKMMILDQLLPKLKERGHKVLIFSQMTKMLDILEDYCFLRGFRNVRIDGQMCRDDRVESINSFTNDPDLFIFLLSTRAGGLGINLTAADTVIIYDSDWNPQNDAQAQDRCHRIGQEKPVVVYRLVSSGTVDEQILERATKKLALEKLIMHKTLFKGNLEQELTSQNTVNPKELLELLESSENMSSMRGAKDESALTEEKLEKLLDRSDMLNKKDDEEPS